MGGWGGFHAQFWCNHTLLEFSLIFSVYRGFWEPKTKLLLTPGHTTGKGMEFMIWGSRYSVYYCQFACPDPLTEDPKSVEEGAEGIVHVQAGSSCLRAAERPPNGEA